MTDLAANPDAVDAPEPSDRRRFLTKGAVAAAVAAAGVAIAKPAEAANGGNFILGAANSATNNTTLSGSQFIVTRSTGNSIQGASSTGTGVLGTAGDSAGGGVGVRGISYSTGIGVWGEGGTSSYVGVGLRGSSTLGPSLQLDEVSRTVPPTSGSWTRGQFMNSAGALWYCYASGAGTASKWVKVSGAPMILGSSYRAYDSRSGAGKILDGQTRTAIDLKAGGGGNAIPSGISAAIVTLTATNTSSAGFLGMFKNGTSWPGTSTINWFANGSNIANTTIVAVDSLSRVSVRAAGSCDFIIDVIGFMP